MGNLREGLQRSWSRVQTQWSTSSSNWRDRKATEFESRYWSVLDSEVQTFLVALEDLDQAIRESQQRVSS